MGHVFLFAIDSLDMGLLNKFKDDLPNFSNLMNNTSNMTSILPPDSASAWPSIYTGLNPAEHGMVYFVDPLDKVNSTVNKIVDNDTIRGKTFWDIAGQNGKRVCILFPHVCYPGWKVNGIMVVRNEIVDNIKSHPEEILNNHNKLDLMVLQGLPTNDNKRWNFIERGKNLVYNEKKFSIELYKKEKWDLFFTYSSVLDYISHNFWNYYDENDPSYHGDNNPFKDTIKNFYILYDKILGEYLKIIDSKTTMLIFSDHGHGIRPPKVFDLNKFLEKKKMYIHIKNQNDKSTALSYFLREIKNYVNKNPWTWNFGMKGINLLPPLRKLFTTPPSVDWKKTLAYSSDQSGIKAYNYGGIIINKNLDNKEYEKIRDDIIYSLENIYDGSEKLFKFVQKRDEFYSGPFISKYPDVIFELIDEYGVGEIEGPQLIGNCSTHNIQPGSHKRYSTVFLNSNVNYLYKTKSLTLMDIKSIILNLIDQNS